MTPTKQRLPGEWLLRIARNLFDDAIVTGVIEPTIADLQQECVDARSGADRALARWRGYFAFWSIVIMAPVTLRQWPGHSRRARAFLRWISVIGVVMILAVAWQPIIGQSTFMSSLAAVSGFSFLAGPLALAYVGGRSLTGGISEFRVGAAEATLFSLLSVTVGATLGAAGVIHTFGEIGRQGTAGLVPVVNGLTGAIRPVLYALATVCLCAVAIAAMSFRAQTGGRTDPAPEGLPAASTRTAVLCAALLCLVVVAADQLLRLNHHTMDWVLAFIGPPKPGTSGRILQQGFSESLMLLFFLGAVLTAVTMATAFFTWRKSRERITHPLLTWTSRIALVVVLGGAVWHAGILNADLQKIEQILVAARTPAG